MRSFTSALIAAALATLISAAPVLSPPELPGVSSLSNTVNAVDTAKSLLDGKTGSLVGGVQARTIPAVNDVSLPKLPQLGTRGDKPSLDLIINEVSTTIHPAIDQLQGMSSSDVSKIKAVVSVIEKRVHVAISQVQDLVNGEKDTIMVSVDGQVMTVDRVAGLLASIVRPILTVVGFLLKFVDDDVKALLAILVTDVFVLVGTVIRLVDGLAAKLGPLISDVGYVLVALGVDISQYGLKC